MEWLLLSLLLVVGVIHATRSPDPKAPRQLSNETRPQPRIVNGNDAPVGRFPYIVSLQRIDPQIKHFCGGTLIAPDIVLTAAHCFANGEEIAVRINPHNRDNPISDSEIFPVEEGIVHPAYRSRNDNNNDIWVIKLGGQSEGPLIRLNENADVPEPKQRLTVAGWGIREFGTTDLPPVLQYAGDNVTYLSNEDCVAITEDGDEGSYAASSVTSDMMCALEPGQGSCQGDSGGPLFIQSDDGFEGDIQVGLVSWGTNCAQPIYPGVFARVSWGYAWIRDQVCLLSENPPDYFLCDDDDVAPTTSPVVPPPQVNILVRIQLDRHPTETGWTILDSRGNVVVDVPIGSYDAKPPGSIISESASLDEGGIYTFLLKDGFGDGISVPIGGVFVFLGDTEDYGKILVHFDGDFKRSKSQILQASSEGTFSIDTPTIAPTLTTPPTVSLHPSLLPTMTELPTYMKQIVTLLINFDTYSSVTLSWRISTIEGVVVVDAPRGTYTPFDGDAVIEIVELDANRNYTFSIVDRDGICCSTGEGFAAIYLGASVNPSEVLLWEQGDFTFSRSQMFSTDPNTAFERTLRPSTAPSFSPAPTSSAAPSVSFVNIVLRLRFDSFPGDVGWKIISSNGEVAAEVPVGGYSLSSCYDVVDEVIALRANGEYTLSVLDGSGDGLCCQNGAGFVAVYFGEIAPDSVLLYLNGEFDDELNGTFVASVIEEITETPSSSPSIPLSKIPTSRPPTASLKPPGALSPNPTSATPSTAAPEPTSQAGNTLNKIAMTLAGFTVFCSFILV